MIYPRQKHPYIMQIIYIIKHYIAAGRQKGQPTMKKIPYTLGLMLPTISPALRVAILEETRVGHNEIYTGKAIKLRDETELLEREVKHIGVNEFSNPPLDGSNAPTLDIFLY